MTGFFFAQNTDAPVRKASTSKTRARLDPNQRGCDACPLRATWPSLLHPKIAAQGPADAEVAIIGEGMIRADDMHGTLFGSGDGKILANKIPRSAHDRAVWQNVTRCYGGETDKGTAVVPAQAAHACQPHILADLDRFPKLKAVLLVGNDALKTFWPNGNVFESHGIPFPIEVGSRVLWGYGIHAEAVVREAKGDKGFGEGPIAPLQTNALRRFWRDYRTWGIAEVVRFDPDAIIQAYSPDEVFDALGRMDMVPLACDLETKYLRPATVGSKLLTSALSDGRTSVAWPTQNDWGVDVLLTILAERHWIAHNGNMELQWLEFLLAERGLSVDDLAPFDDTMGMVRLFFERKSLSGLADASRLILGKNVKELSNLDVRNLENEPLPEVLKYNGLDAQATALIAQRIQSKISPKNYARIIGATRATTRMERLGLPVDQEASQELKAKFQARCDAAEQEARKLYEVKEFERTYQREFVLSNPNDLGTALVQFGKVKLPKTEGGAYSTEEATLERCAGGNPLAKVVLESREAQNVIATWVNPCIEADTLYDDHLLHPGYTINHTATGRLSSDGPNIQNYPARTNREVRKQIIAVPMSPHYQWLKKELDSAFEEARRKIRTLLYKFDFGQLEARVLGMASRDPVLCDSFLSGRDIHKDWFERILEVYPEYWEIAKHRCRETTEKAIRKGGRGIIKNEFVFSSLYGGGAKGTAARTGIPLPIIEQLLEEFWHEFRVAKRWIKARRKEYDETGTSRTLTGRIRRDLMAGNEPINNPIQGTAADIVVDAMNELAEISRRERDPFIHPRIQIHDDLTFFLPEDDQRAEPYIDLIVETMTKIRYEWQTVPLTVEGSVGPNWADVEEFIVYRGDYIR